MSPEKSSGKANKKARPKRIVYLMAAIIVALSLVLLRNTTIHRKQERALGNCKAQLAGGEQKLDRCLFAKKQIQDESDSCSGLLRTNDANMQELNDALRASEGLVSTCTTAKKRLTAMSALCGACCVAAVLAAILK